ncbi:MAG: hypothetical protein R3F19_25485 [Verrucomicrobiales bacterium]
MMIRAAIMATAWVLAMALLHAAFSGQESPLELPLWQLHVLAAIVSGAGAAVMVAWRRPYLYGLFVAMALLMPVGGPVFVLLLAALAKRETPGRNSAVRDPFVCGVPMRESTRNAGNPPMSPLIALFRSLSDARLDQVLSDVVKLETAPLMCLNRKFRDHPNTRVRLVAQGCVAERLNRLERHGRNLRFRAERNPYDPDPLLGLCEVHLAVLEQKLLMPQECAVRARGGMDAVDRILALADRARFETHAAFYEAHFALHLGQRERAAGAWARLVEVTEQQRVLDPGDRYHLLGAEVSLVRGDLKSVCEHVRMLEPDSPEKFWLQEFWLEALIKEAS